MSYMENNELMWWGFDLSNTTHIIKAAKKLMFMCRQSPEYYLWQRRCKVGDYECPICNREFDEAVKAESHHHPKQLYSIIEEKLDEYIMTGLIDQIEPLDFVKEIMKLHEDDKVDYVNLCKGCHELFHAGDWQTINALKALKLNNRGGIENGP